MKNLFLCADDFAQNRSISDGILQLAHLRKLNAISCLTNTKQWLSSHQELKSINSSCWIGLHLNLTFGQALSLQWQKNYGSSFQGLSHLLKKAYLKKLDPTIVAAEINAQIDAFMQLLQQPPDFIDGHQHIHQFPIIRHALMNVYQHNKLTCWVRSSSNGLHDLNQLTGCPKPQLIALLGGIMFKRVLHQTKIPTNPSFAGIYNFSKSKNYRHYFQHFLSISQNKGLIMCHPGLQNDDRIDPLYQSRPNELDYFKSDAFLVDLQTTHHQLKFKG